MVFLIKNGAIEHMRPPLAALLLALALSALSFSQPTGSTTPPCEVCGRVAIDLAPEGASGIVAHATFLNLTIFQAPVPGEAERVLEKIAQGIDPGPILVQEEFKLAHQPVGPPHLEGSEIHFIPEDTQVIELISESGVPCDDENGVATDLNGFAHCRIGTLLLSDGREIGYSEWNRCITVRATYDGREELDPPIKPGQSMLTICPPNVYGTGAFGEALIRIFAIPGTGLICIPLIIILGLLISSMYYSGKNPLALFDITMPRIPQGRKLRSVTRVVAPFHIVKLGAVSRWSVKLADSALAMALKSSALTPFHRAEIDKIVRNSQWSTDRKLTELRSYFDRHNLNSDKQLRIHNALSEALWVREAMVGYRDAAALARGGGPSTGLAGRIRAFRNKLSDSPLGRVPLIGTVLDLWGSYLGSAGSMRTLRRDVRKALVATAMEGIDERRARRAPPPPLLPPGAPGAAAPQAAGRVNLIEGTKSLIAKYVGPNRYERDKFSDARKRGSIFGAILTRMAAKYFLDPNASVRDLVVTHFGDPVYSIGHLHHDMTEKMRDRLLEAIVLIALKENNAKRLREAVEAKKTQLALAELAESNDNRLVNMAVKLLQTSKPDGTRKRYGDYEREVRELEALAGGQQTGRRHDPEIERHLESLRSVLHYENRLYESLNNREEHHYKSMGGYEQTRKVLRQEAVERILHDSEAVFKYATDAAREYRLALLAGNDAHIKKYRPLRYLGEDLLVDALYEQKVSEYRQKGELNGFIRRQRGEPGERLNAAARLQRASEELLELSRNAWNTAESRRRLTHLEEVRSRAANYLAEEELIRFLRLVGRDEKNPLLDNRALGRAGADITRFSKRLAETFKTIEALLKGVQNPADAVRAGLKPDYAVEAINKSLLGKQISWAGTAKWVEQRSLSRMSYTEHMPFQELLEADVKKLTELQMAKEKKKELLMHEAYLYSRMVDGYKFNMHRDFNETRTHNWETYRAFQNYVHNGAIEGISEGMPGWYTELQKRGLRYKDLMKTVWVAIGNTESVVPYAPKARYSPADWMVNEIPEYKDPKTGIWKAGSPKHLQPFDQLFNRAEHSFGPERERILNEISSRLRIRVNEETGMPVPRISSERAGTPLTRIKTFIERHYLYGMAPSMERMAKWYATQAQARQAIEEFGTRSWQYEGEKAIVSEKFEKLRRIRVKMMDWPDKLAEIASLQRKARDAPKLQTEIEKELEEVRRGINSLNARLAGLPPATLEQEEQARRLSPEMARAIQTRNKSAMERLSREVGAQQFALEEERAYLAGREKKLNEALTKLQSAGGELRAKRAELDALEPEINRLRREEKRLSEEYKRSPERKLDAALSDIKDSFWTVYYWNDMNAMRDWRRAHSGFIAPAATVGYQSTQLVYEPPNIPFGRHLMASDWANMWATKPSYWIAYGFLTHVRTSLSLFAGYPVTADTDPETGGHMNRPRYFEGIRSLLNPFSSFDWHHRWRIPKVRRLGDYWNYYLHDEFGRMRLFMTGADQPHLLTPITFHYDFGGGEPASRGGSEIMDFEEQIAKLNVARSLSRRAFEPAYADVLPEALDASFESLFGFRVPRSFQSFKETRIERAKLLGNEFELEAWSSLTPYYAAIERSGSLLAVHGTRTRKPYLYSMWKNIYATQPPSLFVWLPISRHDLVPERLSVDQLDPGVAGYLSRTCSAMEVTSHPRMNYEEQARADIMRRNLTGPMLSVERLGEIESLGFRKSEWMQKFPGLRAADNYLNNLYNTDPSETAHPYATMAKQVLFSPSYFLRYFPANQYAMPLSPIYGTMFGVQKLQKLREKATSFRAAVSGDAERRRFTERIFFAGRALKSSSCQYCSVTMLQGSPHYCPVLNSVVPEGRK